MRVRLLMIVLLALPGCLTLGQVALGETLQVVRSIDLPPEFEYGLTMDLAWDGEHLWVTTLFGEAAIYELEPSDGSVVSSFVIAPPNHHGLAWDGAYLWNTVTMVHGGLPIDTEPDYVEQRSTDGTLVSSFLAPYSPDAIFQGATWDGSYLWLSASNRGLILQVDPADGSLIQSLPSPAADLRGLAWDGNSLWAVDGANDLIYRLSTSGDVLGTWDTPGRNSWGITFDGEHLWVSDDQAKKIFQLVVPEPSSLTILGIGAGSLLVLAWQRRRHCRS